ncbi:MAG: hypothetical protein ABS35_43075 [Kaistia sp. SCN 65-12]|nr:MAG: hypothetical protein ABS35_43075 [Kaistia sp. SCN 65-12]
MPIIYTIDHKERLVLARAEGIITLKDIEDFSDAVVTQDALGYRKMFDASDAAGTYDDNDVMILAARASAYATLTRRGRLALVPRRNAMPDLAERYINLGNFEGRAMIFRTPEEALAWLDSAEPEPGAEPEK